MERDTNKLPSEEEIKEMSDNKFLEFLREFFSDIPEDEWTVNARTDDTGAHCALGHLDEVYGHNCFVTNRAILLTDYPHGDCFLVQANNGRTHRKLHSPKDRVIAFLNETLQKTKE